MFLKTKVNSGIVLGTMMIMSPVAMANYATTAAATVNCQGYTLSVIATDLIVGQSYTINYGFNVICGNNNTPVTGSVTFTATDWTQTVSASGGGFNASMNGGSCYATGGMAVLNFTGSSQPNDSQPNGIPITFGGDGWTPLSCPVVPPPPPPPPPACVIPPSGTAIAGAPVSWNGFTAPAGSVAWVHAHISSPQNVPSNTVTTVDFTGVKIVVNSTSYALPDGHIVFKPGVTTPTTVVNADSSWTTTVPPSFNNDIFFDGQAIPVDANMMNNGHGNTGSTLSFTTSSSDSALKFQWQWSAAVYTAWPGNAAANIEPVHAQLQAGAPQNTAVQKTLIQGPRGGGGSNFTGSWSGTGAGTCTGQ
jgi:hypothetical protein